MKTFKHYFLLSLVIIFASCQQNDLEADDPAGSLQNQEGYSLSIPDGFNFSTERKVRLNITDATPYVRYQVFGYSSTIGSEAQNISDAFNNLFYTGEPYNGSVHFELSISNMYDKVYVSRNDGGESSFEIVDISNNNINISHRSVNTPSNTTKGNRVGSPAEIFYPGGNNLANIAFEDLWPSQGDYDFNDLVISYRIVFHLDIDGINVESMDYIYDVTKIGAGYRNGFGIEFPWDASLYTVTGQRDGAPQPVNTDNGSTVFFFGDANLYLNSPQTLTITFDVTTTTIDLFPPPPYNPFLAENAIQVALSDIYEVHLPNQSYTGYEGSEQPTTFPGFAPSFAQANNDANGDYIVDAGVELNVPPLTNMGGMPWAINIAGTFAPPLPGEFIMKGHLKFLDWAQSGGVDFPDWFMDAPGYRDSNYLETPVTPPATVPDAPTIGAAVAGDGLAIVLFTPPSNDGGSPITGYTATSNPGGFTGTGTSPITVTGLTNGTAYTFSATATSAIGTSIPSLASNSVTPVPSTDVTNPTTGKVWMDRNLGASQVATSSTDAASYGDLYQWGRGADGHQLRTSNTTTTLSSSDTPGNANFILAPNSPWDWRSPQNNNLWQGESGINNPCPTGYRLPTDVELDAERLSWSSNNSVGAFASPLKLTMPGYRNRSNGLIYNLGSSGYYWSSTVNGTNSRNLFFYIGPGFVSTSTRANGYSVRCIKD